MPEREDTRPIKVEVRNLTKRFGDLLVLDNMSFNIRKGEFVCVVGPTGCGKTTFLNCLTRIHMPSEGDLYIDGVPADPRKHNISFVFQEPSALPWLTVEDNLAYGLKIKRIPKAEIDRRVAQILDLMGLWEFRKAYPGELSVSAEQRIIIGRSFAMQPDLLLMDEPYGQMDVKMRFYLEDEVIRLWKELGSTVVFITHNIEEAVYLAERVLILSNKPAKIKEEVRIDLPRPRNITSSRFIEYRNYITDKINGGRDMESGRLNGKTAIVTGGARGIGFGIASRYADEGARVVIADVLEEEGRKAAMDIGPTAEFYQINLRDRGQIFAMADYVHETYGHIDILVNCAGVARPCPTLKLAEEVLDEVIDINMKAPLFCCQAVGAYMRRDGGGSIVNISSGNTRMINVGRVPYGITKGAVNLLTEQLGAEWALYNIKVNAIAPGWIRTEMVEKPLKSGILDEEAILSVSPVGRFGKTEEIASLASFLACKESDYIVGQVIFADGGWSLGIMPHALDYIRENEED